MLSANYSLIRQNDLCTIQTFCDLLMKLIHYDKWKKFAPLGLGVIGLGFSLTAEAAARKSRGAPKRKWVPLGTVGLCVFNSGVAIFGDAVKHRALYEMK